MEGSSRLDAIIVRRAYEDLWNLNSFDDKEIRWLPKKDTIQEIVIGLLRNNNLTQYCGMTSNQLLPSTVNNDREQQFSPTNRFDSTGVGTSGCPYPFLVLNLVVKNFRFLSLLIAFLA
ncbi:hypothetical protein RND71_014352 [Anisodus tanguticus]|uniref:Uncharacterized protein n=1 Tax=Anisodus tanguticus TaxID=243964 RepID=A0AAE1VEZ4_9SOLA|nr:hypothetical protein RND71_014352 [Anisodus tanguticus]